MGAVRLAEAEAVVDHPCLEVAVVGVAHPVAAAEVEAVVDHPCLVVAGEVEEVAVEHPFLVVVAAVAEEVVHPCRAAVGVVEVAVVVRLHC